MSRFVPQSKLVDEKLVRRFANELGYVEKLLVLTGAGISTESGIPDYRSKDVGLYARSNHKPVQHIDFMKSANVRRRYWARNYLAWPVFGNAKCNRNHYEIAQWENSERFVWLITQNVDGLHVKAGSKMITELHGSGRFVRCMRCDYHEKRDNYQRLLEELNPGFMQKYTNPGEMAPDGDVMLEPDAEKEFIISDCPKCGGIIKTDVIFFGNIFIVFFSSSICDFSVDECDGVLVLGSSLSVMSGYRFIYQAHKQDKPIFIVNIGPTRADHLATMNEVESEKFLNLAAAAYADAENVTSRQSCIDLSYPNDNFRVLMVMSTPCDKHSNQCQAFVAISDETSQVIVSFRGTNSGGQLLTEFSNGLQDLVPFIETDGSDNQINVGNVNVYFLNAMNQMWDNMVHPSIITRQNYTYLLTGHSLGGAIATLTAFRIAFRQYSTKIKVHTFGEPRVGDMRFANYFSDVIPYAFRVVHSTDPVPHLPPLHLDNLTADGYPYHHPREIWYNNDFTNYVLCDPINGEDFECSDKKRFWDYGRGGALRHTHYFNHFVSEYGADGCNNSRLSIMNFWSLYLLATLSISFYYSA
ncbi:unnamed protein product [Caenorhabditis bovis]|uniref:Deacetylase sirtuin-type domain-containing protein n=1 Tax=Caenorhabditis bovis TaxID=2654633 RepID=A0A8S1EMM4_9PELO|nr:unnamed protein product [Caenorhabditis bovis]